MSLILKNISYKAGDVNILNDVSLSVEKGEIVSLVGPNGAGKSTLLNILTGDINPDSGEVFYENFNLNELNILDRSFYRSVMSQSQQIVFDFSVKEIIEMGWLDKGNAQFSEHFDQAVLDISLYANSIIYWKENLIDYQVGNREEFILPELCSNFGDHLIQWILPICFLTNLLQT